MLFPYPFTCMAFNLLAGKIQIKIWRLRCQIVERNALIPESKTSS